MHADFCVDALNEAIARYGPPEVMNTDQGSQFTGSTWITTLTKAGMRISMDGRGRYLDNIFIERLWRSLKQEAIYLEEIDGGKDTKANFYFLDSDRTIVEAKYPNNPKGFANRTQTNLENGKTVSFEDETLKNEKTCIIASRS